MNQDRDPGCGREDLRRRGHAGAASVTKERGVDDVDREMRRAVRAEVRGVVERAAVRVFGAPRTIGRRTVAGAAAPRIGVATLPGVRAAALVRDQAAHTLWVLVGQARAEGVTWQVVAEQLGVVDPTGDRAPAELVFEHLTRGAPLAPVVERPSRSLYGPTFFWSCNDCHELVVDQGPYPGHPDEQEHGHADDCTRRAASVRAYDAARNGGGETEARG